MAFVFSTVHLLLMLRALVVSVRGRFGFGIAGGAVRVLLLVAGALLTIGNGALVVTRHVAAGGSSGSASAVSAALSAIAVAGPALTLALVVLAYRRCQDVPAAQEAELQKPFDAWLLVGAQDLLGVVIAVAAAWFANSWP